MTTFTIDGSAISDIPSLYDEINRVFMGGEEWRLGESLDALDDLLYGGYGQLAAATGQVRIEWMDAATSRRALGRDTTIAYYREKLRHPETFDAERFTRLLAEVEADAGATYFDLVMNVFAGHPEIALTLA